MTRPKNADLVMQPQVNPHVILQAMADGALLMNTETGDCFELNSVGKDVWLQLENGKTTAEIVDAIAQRFSADEAVVLADVTSLIATLAHHGVLLRK